MSKQEKPPFVPIDSLWVTQNQLRDYKQIDEMIQHVMAGGRWDFASVADYQSRRNLPVNVAPIVLNRFEDGEYHIQDGHHRILATFLACRELLYENEFEVTHYTYQQYAEINLAKGWYTPFDPRTEVRKPDLLIYKAIVANLPPDEAVSFIIGHSDWFRESRRFKFVDELAFLG